MGSESDSRFAHLLQPIRDLADNWNIDIARELEDYLGELEKITFSFDGVSSSLNFAQAALVIQGSAVVYSKKVEYLYALLYQTLDFLAEKKQKKAQSDANADANDAVESEPDFLSLDDDDLQEGNGIDLVEGDAPARRQSSHIGLSMPFPIISEPVVASEDTPTNAPRNSGFTINSCYIHSSGAYVLDAAFIGDDLRSTSSTPYATPRPSILQQETRVAEPNGMLNQTLNTTNPLSTTLQEPLSIADITAGAGGFEFGGAGAMSDDEDNDDEEGPSIFTQFAASTSSLMEKSAEVTNRAQQMVAKKVRGKRDRPQKRIADLWATLDPHEEVGSNKPFKKGKPYRIRTITKPQQPEGDAVVPILSIAETPFSFRGVRGPDFQEFSYLYSVELKRRKDAQKRDKLEFSFEETVYAVAEEEEEEERLDFTRHEMSAHFNGAVEVEVPEPDNAGFEGVDDDDDDEVDIGDAGILDQDDPVDTQSYEDFYTARVEQFIAETAAYAQETNLSKRVNDWKSKLAPFLEEQESHPNFDMQEYGETLILTLKDEYEGKPGVKITKEGDVSASDEMIVSFEKLTVGAERYEVARRFAAVLQLVNNENVSVVTTKEVDSLSFHLLSVKPKYDIENYLAPSLNPSQPSSASSSSSTTSGAKKARAEDREESSEKTKGTKAKRGRKEDKEDKEEEEEEEEGPIKKRPGRPKKDETKGTTKGKRAAAATDDKENNPNRSTRPKRSTRSTVTHAESDEEEKEESLRGPRTKMFAEVTA